MKKEIITILTILIISITSCGGGSSSEEDNTKITLGDTITYYVQNSTTITASWGQAQTNNTTNSTLYYKLIKSTELSKIDSIDKANSIIGDNLVMDWTFDQTTCEISNLIAGLEYYITVLVKDSNENILQYEPIKAITQDPSAPVVTSDIYFSDYTGTSIIVNWDSAKDDATPESELEYLLVKSTDKNLIDSIDKIKLISDEKLVFNWTSSINKYTVYSLSNRVKYYFSLLVKDSSGEITLYSPQAIETNDIYIGGSITETQYATSKPCYWKNGTISLLKTNYNSGYVKDIYVVDNDIFSVGFSYYGTYWKNTAKTALSSSGHSIGNTIYYDGTSLIFGGQDYIEDSSSPNGFSHKAAYWKNGTVSYLSIGYYKASVNSIDVYNNKVYAAGYQLNGSTSSTVKKIAKYWVNSSTTILGSNTEDSEINKIIVLNGNVHCAGYKGKYAAYWKNSTLTKLAYNAKVYDMFISENDIYCAGNIGNKAVYWKNGEPVYLTDGDNESFVTGIYVINSEIYCTGDEYTNYISHGKLWKNGKKVNLKINNYSSNFSSIHVIKK